MENVSRYIIIAWLVIASVLLFIPAGILIITSPRPKIISIPNPPVAPSIPGVPSFDSNSTKELREEQGKAYAKYIEAQISRYDKQVSAYKEYVSALKAQSDARAHADAFAAYQLVAKDTLASLVNGLIVALAGYVFIKTGSEAVAKYQAAKRRQ